MTIADKNFIAHCHVFGFPSTGSMFCDVHIHHECGQRRDEVTSRELRVARVLSSIASARSRLSLTFSSSSVLSQRASDAVFAFQAQKVAFYDMSRRSSRPPFGR